MILDASALDKDPEGTALLRAVLDQGRKPRRAPREPDGFARPEKTAHHARPGRTPERAEAPVR